MLRADQGQGQMTDDTTQKRPYTKHVHRFWIPVEWEYELGENPGGDQTGPQLVYTAMRATVLRCDCGKEIRRDSES